jgi:hypothetical protein
MNAATRRWMALILAVFAAARAPPVVAQEITDTRSLADVSVEADPGSSYE